MGAVCRLLEEEGPGTAARLLAALEEAKDDPIDGPAPGGRPATF